MAEKDGSDISGQESIVIGPADIKTDRAQRILNSLMNTTILLMSQMMGIFSQVLVGTIGAVATEMTTAFAGEEEGQRVEQEMQQKLPEVDEKMKATISEMRNDIYAQIGQNRNEIEPYFSDVVYDRGPEIIEKYDFGLPRLTEELNDDTIAQYSLLIAKEDPRFMEMFTGLLDWMNSLPKMPEKSEE